MTLAVDILVTEVSTSFPEATFRLLTGFPKGDRALELGEMEFDLTAAQEQFEAFGSALDECEVAGDVALPVLFEPLRGSRLDRLVQATIPLEVVETGTYEPNDGSLTRLLTARQQEVLEAAIRVGYYSAPRDGTQEDVAEYVDIAPTTAGEHLRKIEERVFTTIVH